MELKCTFYVEGWWPQNRPKYTCRIANQSISERKIAYLLGDHARGKSNEDVTAIWFDACPMTKFPKNLVDLFANLDTLYINNCGLKSLSGEDLSRVPGLKELLVINNELRELEDYFLSENKHLELVTLSNNKISIVGAKVFKKCASEKLKMVDLRGNLIANAVFAKESVFFPSGNDYLRISSLKRLAKLLREEKDSKETKNSLFNDLKTLLADDSFRDFTIKVERETFKVHRFVLIARSPVIAEMIRARPECDSLELIDIPVGVWRAILAYIYRDEMPPDDTNMIEIYGAACRLEIRGLREQVTENLMDIVCAFNAVEVLTLSAKYDDEPLMTKAFEEIQKMFPDKKLKSELMRQPERMREMIAAKRSMDEQLRRVREEFEENFYDKVEKTIDLLL